MGTTVYLDASRAADVGRAAELLREGGLVAFATETVYGLGANALSAAAVAGIFVAKQRPAWDPLIVHVATVEQVAEIAVVPVEIAARVAALARAFWPGPLTLLLPRSAVVPDAVTAGRALVGVRVPAHPAAQALLRACGLPIAAPSANVFGHTSPTTAEHVLADLEGRIDAVLDAGATPVGVESTVVDPLQTPMVLYRPGAVTAEQMTAVTGVGVRVFEAGTREAGTREAGTREAGTSEAGAREAGAREAGAREIGGSPEALPSPGVGLRHYAPRAPLVLVEEATGELERALLAECARWQEAGRRVGVMLPEGWDTLPGSSVYEWGRWDDAAMLAARLFAGLRELDERGVEVIVCPVPGQGGVLDAIRDRLRKAARA
jgi:L-threonylcarbamoyladenylate synthase